MRLNHVGMIIFSGVAWLGIGVFLLIKGLTLVFTSLEIEYALSPLLSLLTPLAGSRQQAALVLIALAFVAGFCKGKFVLSKTVKRIVDRVRSLPAPLSFSQVYPRSYYILILLMVGLGLSMRWLPIGIDIRGAVDVAVGSALINGSFLYFRSAIASKKTPVN